MRWVLLILEVLLGVLGVVFLPIWAALLVIILVVVVAFSTLVWLFLAPTNRFFTFVDEGTAKIVVRGGQFRKVLIQLEGFTLDPDGNVVAGRERHLLGGLRPYGIWPIDDIYIYRFQWANVLYDGTIKVHEPEWLDYILLKQDVYFFKEETAEDADLLPLEVHILLTIRVMNPYKALFLVQDWLETIINRFRPTVRDRIAQERYEQLVAQKGAIGGQLFTASDQLRQEFIDQYGVEVRAVEIKEINPPEEFRAETLRRWTAEREAERIRVEAVAEADRRRRVADGERDRIATEYGAVRHQGIVGWFIRWLESKYGR